MSGVGPDAQSEAAKAGRQERQQRAQTSMLFGILAGLGWFVCGIVLWFVGLAGSDGGSFLNWLLTGVIVTLLFVAVAINMTMAGLDRARPRGWRRSTVENFAKVLIVLSALAGAALAILLRGFA